MSNRALLPRPIMIATLLAAAVGLVTVGCDKSSSKSESTSDKPTEEKEQAKNEETKEESAKKADEKTAEGAQGPSQVGPPIIKGNVRPGRITETSENWRKRLESVEVDPSVAKNLGDVKEGATVDVYFGTWCGDSLREVPRLWKSLELVEGDVPFNVEYVALDRSFSAGDVSIEEADITFVPTFVVKRDGEEVGRIVESAPQTLEKDLLALLSGETSGVVSGRKDL